MADVTGIAPDGRMAVIDSSELEAARKEGFRSITELSLPSHRPYAPEQPSIPESAVMGLGRGLLGPLFKQLVMGAGATGGGYGQAPGVPPQAELKLYLDARDIASKEANPKTYVGSEVAGALALAAAGAAAGSAVKGAISGKAISSAAKTLPPAATLEAAAAALQKTLGPRAAIEALRPKFGEAAAGWMGREMGGLVGLPGVGAAVGLSPYALRVATNPALYYQGARALPAVGGALGAGQVPLDALEAMSKK